MAYPSPFKRKTLLADLYLQIAPLKILLESDVEQLNADDMQQFCNQYVFKERICSREAFTDFIEGCELSLVEMDYGYHNSMFEDRSDRELMYWWFVTILLDDLGEMAKDQALTLNAY